MFQVQHLVIGAGAVGLAIARSLSRRGPTLLIEQHSQVGFETTSRNSQVIHSGFYYPPLSLKSLLCIRGRQLLYDYLISNHVLFQKCGKWVVAASSEQQEQLEELYTRAQELKVPVQYVPDFQHSMIKAHQCLLFPESGILDVHGYTQSLLYDFTDNGGDVCFKTRLVGIELHHSEFIVTCQSLQTNEEYKVQASVVVNAAGLHADTIAHMVLPRHQIPKLYFCKGHYFTTFKKIANKLVYPVPSPNLVSLGMHLTIDLQGGCKFGPDVMYISNKNDYSFQSLKKDAIKDIQRYVKGIEESDLEVGYTGIRPKLQEPNGPFRDYLIKNENGFINLMGIESPGLTSSLAIAEYVDQIL